MSFLHLVFVAKNPGPSNCKEAPNRKNEGIRQFRYFKVYEIDHMVKNGKIISGPTLAALDIVKSWLRTGNHKL